jgi:glyceraldehyde 3-phosphate dehydrogenase
VSRSVVPVVVGSISDVAFVVARETTADEVNDVLCQETSTDRHQGILAVADEPLVSADLVKGAMPPSSSWI